MNVRSRRSGLTMIEVIVAIAILGIAVAVLATTAASSIRNNAISGERTQATQVLNYLGRLVAGADPILFADADLKWGYGQLRGSFIELTKEVGRANPDLYRAQVQDLGWIGIGDAQMVHYRVSVCWMAAGNEQCVRGDTAGPEIIEDDPNPAPLPGIG